MKDKRFFVTGACGFIGSHLVKRLLQTNADVSILIRKNTNCWRLTGCEKDLNIYTCDLTDTKEINSLIKNIKPDYVFHLAAYGVDSKQKDYFNAINTNILGTVNLLTALKDTGCCRFINVGSCAEYGDRKELMQETLCPEPVSIYGSTKASSTILAHQIARENNIGIATLRPFGVFGEGEERHKVFSDIILSILEGKDVPLTLCEQYRDYCYVENIVDALLLAAQSSAVKNEIFNVGSGVSYPLKHYVDLIFKYMNTDRKPLYGAVEYRKNEMWGPRPDVSKIKSLLNWQPRISLEEGIKLTTDWYKLNWVVLKNG